MSIMGAVAAGGIIGKAVSGYMFNYTKSVYEAKISELEGLISRLNEHLTTMENLRSQLPHFWDDENAQKTCKALDDTITRTKQEMATAESLTRIYRATVDSLDRSKDKVKNLVDDALGLLRGLSD